LLALPSYQENFGLCVMEALACGVPVLVSPHVNLAEEIEAAGAGWISPVKAESLCETLTSALRDQDELSRRGALGRLLAQRFNWHNVAEMLAQLYESVQQGETENA
jgi:glycosyltransferase involved in cell wall biosynthesis